MMPPLAWSLAGVLTVVGAAAPSLQRRAPLAPVDVPGLGKMHGGVSKFTDSVALFLGVPYAEPPKQRLRWQPPIPHAPWRPAVLNATAFGSACPQSGKAEGSGFDEDCLFLNVATPTSALGNRSARLPVLFWIHGGGYETGASNFYFGDSIVDASVGSVVVVTINYRLNVFGFLGGEEISASTKGAGSGNFGIMDQRLALQWVKQHIAAFGGDSNNVTIFGESAGGNSVINHLAQPASFGFYQKAIVESGAYDEGAQNMSMAEISLEAVLAKLECSDLDCLRAKDAALVEGAASAMVFTGPTVDGVSLTDTPAALIAAKKYNSKVPVLIGSNRDEMAFFTVAYKYPPDMTEAQMERYFVQNHGYSRTEIAQIKTTYSFSPGVEAKEAGGQYVYPKDLGPYSKWYWMYMRATTDSVPGLGPCGVRWMDRLLVAGGTPAVYSYLFAHPPVENLGIPGEAHGVFAPHASEIAFVYGSVWPFVSKEEAVLARQMCSYWLAFAKSGRPSVDGAPTW
eukprot:SAG31_NODE_1837_length_7126_cov_8.278497_1_plen_511_part_00